MYDRTVKIYGNEARLLRRLIWWASQYGVRKKVLTEDKSDFEWINGSPVTSFSLDEEIGGEEFLASLGLEKFKYVCFTVRSESYYLARISEGQRLVPNTVRNPPEATYLQMANELGSSGAKVLRMGKDMPKTVSVDAHFNVLDYAAQFRTEFLDVYLMKYCKFAFIGNTGIFWIRKMFNSKTVHCDMYQIKHVPIAPDIFIIQKLWLVHEHRLATFKEMIQIESYSVEKRMELLGVELVKNTVDEIKAVCDEMNARIDGTWVTTEEDEELQRRYQELIVKYSNKPEWNGGGRIGAQFLRENQDLLRE
jgi:putative glycosyltransferase (TIGR04372 family)